MRCKYQEQDYATRMDGGIAFYDGRPVWMHVAGAVIAISNFPKGDNAKKISSADPLLDLASPKLGYVNYEGTAYYVYRRPERKYKQTLNYGSCSLHSPNGTKIVHHIEHVFSSKGMLDTLNNKYPSLADTMARLKTQKAKAVAISRNICLAIDSFGIIRVHFKMEEVGYINPGEKIVRVPKGAVAWIVSKYLEGYDWVVE